MATYDTESDDRPMPGTSRGGDPGDTKSYIAGALKEHPELGAIDYGNSNDPRIQELDRRMEAARGADARKSHERAQSGKWGIADELNDPHGQTNTRADRHNNAGTGHKTPTSPASARELKNNEEAANKHHDGDAKPNSPNQVGNGYKSDNADKKAAAKAAAKKQKFMSKLGSSSKLKQRMMIAGAAAGGSAAVGVIVFMALLPLKIEMIVKNIESEASATTTNALDNESQALISNYVKESILPGLSVKGCPGTTLSPKCVGVPAGTGPIKTLYAAWNKARFENTLATKFGLVMAKKGQTYYLNFDGKTIDLKELRAGDVDFFHLPGTFEVSATQLSDELKHVFQEGTLWDRTYGRLKLNKYTTALGQTHCFGWCSTKLGRAQTTFATKVSDWKLYGRVLMINYVVAPLSENMSIIMTCVMSGNCDTTLHPSNTSGDEDEFSGVQKQIADTLARYAEANSVESLDKLLKISNDIGENGLKKTIVAAAIKAAVGGSAEDAADTASDAVDGVGYILMAAKVISGGANLAKDIKYIGYAANLAAAESTFNIYSTMAAQAKSGATSLEAEASLTQTLNGGIDTTTPSNAEDTPYYNQIMNIDNAPKQSVFASLFGDVYADSANANYKCDDGKPVANGKLVCPEEDFTRGNQTANDISAGVNSIPGLVPVAGAISGAGDVINAPVEAVVSRIPGVSAATNWAGEHTGQMTTWMGDKVLQTPFDNLSGGRTFDMMAAGAQGLNNCQVTLGCAEISPEAYAQQVNKQRAQDEAQFDATSTFARMFSTSSPYSLISRLAMSMPTDVLTATNNSLASILTNPLNSIGSLFSSMLSSNHAFAATTAMPSPFGEPYTGITQLPSAAEQDSYWDENCVNGPLGVYDDATGTEDDSAWVSTWVQDNNSGAAVAQTPNYCMTINGTVQSLGGKFDSRFWPSGTTTGTAVQTTDVTTGVYQIGDSITDGLQNAGKLSQAFSAKGLTVSQINATDGIGIAGAQANLDADAANIRSSEAMVVQLGTYDYANSLGDDQKAIDSFVTAVRSINPGINIYWVNAYSKTLDVSTINAAIDTEATGENYTVIDWNQEVTSNPKNYTFAKDGTTLSNASSYAAMGNFEIGQISEAGA